MIDPTLTGPADGHRGVLAWRLTSEAHALSSAPVGGGRTRPGWIVNVRVPLDYARTDLDAHIAEVAATRGLSGDGIGLLTAAPVERWTRGSCDGVVVDATVGVSKPTWAADPDGGWNEWNAGTINLVVQLPVALEPGADVNAVMTATEAKTQALFDHGVPGTGTASDAIATVWPSPAAAATTARFAGPRSPWGARIARATHEAVLAGLAGVER